MSLIHTGGGGASTFDYLAALQRNTRELARNRSHGMQWNYTGTLAPPAQG